MPKLIWHKAKLVGDLNEKGCFKPSPKETKSACLENEHSKSQHFIMVWFLCLMAYQLFLGYLIPNLFSEKNSSGTI